MTDHYAEMWRQVIEEAGKRHIEPWKLAMMMLEEADKAAERASSGFSRQKPKPSTHA